MLNTKFQTLLVKQYKDWKITFIDDFILFTNYSGHSDNVTSNYFFFHICDPTFMTGLSNFTIDLSYVYRTELPQERCGKCQALIPKQVKTIYHLLKLNI